MKTLFKDSKVHMSNVSAKKISERKALAYGKIHVGEFAFNEIMNDNLPKGNPLTIAEVAGVIGAKKTADILPLCHPIDISAVWVEIIPNKEESCFEAYVLATTIAKTGIEMEALSGVTTALLNIYDMTKPIEPTLTISDVHLLVKTGGKKGVWVCTDGIPPLAQAWLDNELKVDKVLNDLDVTTITMSDRASQGVYEDTAGESAKEILNTWGANVVAQSLIGDEKELLEKTLQEHLSKKPEIIFTLGGTGLGGRDITVETLLPLFNKNATGLSQMLKAEGVARFTDKAWLSNSTVGIIDETLIITLPGSKKAVIENLDICYGIIKHAINMKNGIKNHGK